MMLCRLAVSGELPAAITAIMMRGDTVAMIGVTRAIGVTSAMIGVTAAHLSGGAAGMIGRMKMIGDLATARLTRTSRDVRRAAQKTDHWMMKKTKHKTAEQKMMRTVTIAALRIGGGDPLRAHRVVNPTDRSPPDHRPDTF